MKETAAANMVLTDMVQWYIYEEKALWRQMNNLFGCCVVLYVSLLDDLKMVIISKLFWEEVVRRSFFLL